MNVTVIRTAMIKDELIQVITTGSGADVFLQRYEVHGKHMSRLVLIESRHFRDERPAVSEFNAYCVLQH